MTRDEKEKLEGAFNRFASKIFSQEFEYERIIGLCVRIDKEDYRELQPFLNANGSLWFTVGEVEERMQFKVSHGTVAYNEDDDFVLIGVPTDVIDKMRLVVYLRETVQGALFSTKIRREHYYTGTVTEVVRVKEGI